MTNNQRNRFWEVDTIRGLAVVAMIYFHFMWDLSFFGLADINIMAPGWQAFARSIGSTFIFVMGVSLTLSYHQAQAKAGTSSLFTRYLWRGLKIFAWGMLITALSYLMFMGLSGWKSSNGFIIFGILHLIGLSTILAYPFLRSPWLALGGAIVVIAAGTYIDSMGRSDPWLIWLGVKQYLRSMVDYYPLLPWFGLALSGVFVGQMLYPNRVPRFPLPDLSQVPPIRGLRFLGRHSLFIYLVHQPILIGLLYLGNILGLVA